MKLIWKNANLITGSIGGDLKRYTLHDPQYKAIGGLERYAIHFSDLVSDGEKEKTFFDKPQKVDKPKKNISIRSIRIFKGKLEEDEDMVIMSRDEFIGRGKQLKNVACCYTPFGEEPC